MDFLIKGSTSGSDSSSCTSVWGGGKEEPIPTVETFCFFS